MEELRKLQELSIVSKLTTGNAVGPRICSCMHLIWSTAALGSAPLLALTVASAVLCRN